MVNVRRKTNLSFTIDHITLFFRPDCQRGIHSGGGPYHRSGPSPQRNDHRSPGTDPNPCEEPETQVVAPGEPLHGDSTDGQEKSPKPPAAPTTPDARPISFGNRSATSWNTTPFPNPIAPVAITIMATAIESEGLVTATTEPTMTGNT